MLMDHNLHTAHCSHHPLLCRVPKMPSTILESRSTGMIRSVSAGRILPDCRVLALEGEVRFNAYVGSVLEIFWRQPWIRETSRANGTLSTESCLLTESISSKTRSSVIVRSFLFSSRATDRLRSYSSFVGHSLESTLLGHTSMHTARYGIRWHTQDI
jgi:hypothetical protein